jgi:hypothetical protein
MYGGDAVRVMCAVIRVYYDRESLQGGFWLCFAAIQLGHDLVFFEKALDFPQRSRCPQTRTKFLKCAGISQKINGHKFDEAHWTYRVHCATSLSILGDRIYLHNGNNRQRQPKVTCRQHTDLRT